MQRRDLFLPHAYYKADFLTAGAKLLIDRVGIRPGAVQYLLLELSQDAGIKDTPHTLRHAFAKSLIDAGVGIEQVATVLGHTSLETTRIYITPTAQDLVKAVVIVGLPLARVVSPWHVHYRSIH